MFPCGFINSMIYIIAYENLRHKFKHIKENLHSKYPETTRAYFFSGLLDFMNASIAETLSLLFFLPGDVVRTRMQAT